MLGQKDTALVVVDVQGKLAQLMHDKESVYSNIERLIRSMQILGIPILWVEQIPEKMGKTIPRLAALLEPLTPIPKTSFGCCGEPAFMQALDATGRKNVLVTGIETHVCVYQTAAELAGKGYHVEVVADAVSSRLTSNRQLGLEKIVAAGAFKTSTEMAILELVRDAADPKFRDILKVIK
jgi:nicotinamidase-related amidase